MIAETHTVETPLGPVRGTRTVGADRISVFRGIRYAEAPVGTRRFRPPEPTAAWHSVYDATVAGPRAIQPPSLLTAAPEPEDEDCLSLNIWTPDVSARQAVMVWIHGGSFTSGSGSQPYYDGTRLAQRGVVVVSINYRLGALGFLHLGEFDDELVGTANLGLQDQTLALAWVRDNIAAFGGDPDRVTLFGESAGAMSAAVHLASPGSRGLFRRVIAQSGAAGHVQSAASGTKVAEAVLDSLGLGPGPLDRGAGRGGHRLLDRLQGVSAAALRQAVHTVSRQSVGDTALAFCPTIDGVTISEHPVESLRSGSSCDVDLLCGTNADEMNLFRVQDLLSGTSEELNEDRLRRRLVRALEFWGSSVGLDEALARYRDRYPYQDNSQLWSTISTDTTFRAHMFAMADAHAARGRVWSYHFTQPSSAFGGALGACHAVEVPFVFDNLDQPGVEVLLGELTPRRRRFAAALADTWAQFASVDDPSQIRVPATSDCWLRYRTGPRYQAVLDLDSRQVEGLDADLMSIWVRTPEARSGVESGKMVS